MGNQLLNFISIYAYCLEKGYRCQNPSFFEYNRYFEIPIESKAINFLFFKTYSFYSSFLPFRVARKIGRIFYNFYINWVQLFKKHQIIYPKTLKKGGFLPPTKESEGRLRNLEEAEDIKTIYFHGWIFKNPIGIQKYRKEIVEYFKPKEAFRERVNKFIEKLRKKYEHIVGVHIRQRQPGIDEKYPGERGDFKIFISPKDMPLVLATLHQYLEHYNKDLRKTCFVICSNDKVNPSFFKGLNVVISRGDLIEDLYILSRTDAIIGCLSTFGKFASYYGDIPWIIFNKNGINWSKYLSKN